MTNKVHEYRPRLQASSGIAGMFWWMPRHLREQRIRELGKVLNVQTVAALTRESERRVRCIVDGDA